MKLTKRILATLVAVVFVLTSFVTVPAFAAFTDLTAEDDSYEAVDVLSKLGVINGYDDGSFKPANNVTRAEFTAMLLRTRGMGSVGSTSLENPPFPDVVSSDVSWAIANIRTAHEMGIINGYDDGTFKPNNNVSYEEAIKMIVCALGYGEMGSEGAAWYSKYLVTAQSLGFLNGAGGVISTPATRATIAKMLYNCLEVKLAENNAITNKTILENDLRLTKKVGYISATPALSLVEPDSNLRDNEITITSADEYGKLESKTFQVDDMSKYADMIGAQITYYYTEDREAGKINLLMAQVKNSQEMEIDASMITSFSSGEIKYLRAADAERTSSVGIAPGSIVVYNDKLFGATAADSSFASYCSVMNDKAMPTIGKIKLLDRDGDGKYDVLFIDSYTAWFASSTTSSSYTVVDNVLRKDLTADQNRIILDPYASGSEVKFLTADGAASSFSAIRKGTIICYKESNSANGGTILKTAVICNNSVNGTITTTNSKTGVTISGKTYKFSKQAPWESAAAAAGVLAEPVRGDGGTFYLDINGNIIAYDKTETKVNQEYGYLISVRENTDEFETEVYATIVTKSNVKGKRYTITDKTKLNGNTYAISEYKTMLEEANDDYEASYGSSASYAQAVKFVAKGDEISEIYTATVPDEIPETAPTDAIHFYDEITADDGANYSNSQFYTGSSKKIYVSNATILKVPTNKSETSKYRFMSSGDLEKNSSGAYRVELFDVNSTNSAKFVIVHQGASNVGEVKYNSPVFVITDIQNDGDGDYERYTLNGYVGTSKKEGWQLSVEDSATVAAAAKLEVGDVVRLGTDEEGFYTLKFTESGNADNQHIIFKYEDGFRDELASPNHSIHVNTAKPEYEVVWGVLYERSEEGVILAKDMGGSDVRDEIIAASAFDNAKIFIYTTENNELVITEVEKEKNWETIDGLTKYTADPAGAAEVFVHMNNGSVKTMIIVER